MTKFQIGELTVVQGRVRTVVWFVVCLCLAVSSRLQPVEGERYEAVGYGTAGDGWGYKSVRIPVSLCQVASICQSSSGTCSLNGIGEGQLQMMVVVLV